MDETASLALRRTAEMAAMFMIGDGMLGLTRPDRHVALWETDVRQVNALTKPFQGHPTYRRLYGTLQIAAGLGLAAFLTRRR